MSEELEDNILFAVYDLTTGRILRAGGCQEDTFDDQADPMENEGVVVSPSDEVSETTHYVDLSGPEPEVVERPVLTFDKYEIVANGIDTATMTGLPSPVTVIVDEEEDDGYVVTGGVLEVDALVPATYTILIDDPFPAQSFEGEIVAT